MNITELNYFAHEVYKFIPDKTNGIYGIKEDKLLERFENDQIKSDVKFILTSLKDQNKIVTDHHGWIFRKEVYDELYEKHFHSNGLSKGIWEEVFPSDISVTGKPLRKFRLKLGDAINGPIYTEQDHDAVFSVKIDQIKREPFPILTKEDNAKILKKMTEEDERVFAILDRIGFNND